MSYQTEYDFYRDLARLIDEGVSLRGLNEAMLTIEDSTRSLTDGAPSRIRDLSKVWTQRPVLVPIRLAELFDGLSVAHSDDYVLTMIAGLGGRHETEIRAFMLRHDHVLREEVFWRIFEVEGGGEISLANIDKYSREEGNWHHTVVELVTDGTLDRTRVLRSCLEALNRDFSAYRAGWFSRVYADLAPTPFEAAADQDLLLLTLGSSITASASLAVKQLAGVHKAGRLDAPAFVEACAPALTGPKGSAATVLRMLVAIGAKHAADAEGVADAIAQGLAHPHADAQRAAVKALRKLGRDDLIEESRDGLAPAVAAELLPDAGGGPEAVIEIATALPDAKPVRAWTDDDAPQRYAALLEDSSDAIEFELALAWLASSESAGAVLRPLLKRAQRLLSKDEDCYAAALALVAVDPTSECLPQTYWRSVSTSVVKGEVTVVHGEPEARPTAEQRSVLPSLVTRLREIASILQGSVGRRPLMATPTDSHGWVDADTLIARLRQLKTAAGNSVPLPADVTQAVLRVRTAERDRVLDVLGVSTPRITETIGVEWIRHESESKKPNGTAMWVWWWPTVHADPAEAPCAEHPALIPTARAGSSGMHRGTTDLVTAQLALVHPASTLALTAVGVGILNSAVSEAAEQRAGAVLASLAGHPGDWTPETAQLVALGMSAARAEIRAQAVELLAAAIPRRISAAEAATGFAACAPACTLSRWGTSFADAGSLAPAVVVDVLTALLPHLDRTARGIGTLLTVLLDESTRLRRQPTDSVLCDWLSGFTGSSASATAARRLLKLG